MVIRNRELEMCGEMKSAFLLHINRQGLMMAVKSKRVAIWRKYTQKLLFGVIQYTL